MSKSSSVKSGQFFSTKSNSEYTDCHGKKLLNLISPLVLITRSGSGSSFVYNSFEIASSFICSNSIFPSLYGHPVIRQPDAPHREGTPPCGLGRGRRREGRVRALHAQGDPRAAPCHPGGHCRPHPRWSGGAAGPEHDGSADPGHQQDLHCGLRIVVPRGDGGQVQSGADAAAQRGGVSRLRVPVQRSHRGQGRSGHRHQPVRRDAGHHGGPAGGQAPGRPHPEHR